MQKAGFLTTRLSYFTVLWKNELDLFQCNKISRENGAAHHLDKEARKWATKIAKENKSLREYQRALKLLGTGDRVNITVFLCPKHCYLKVGKDKCFWYLYKSIMPVIHSVPFEV